MRHKYHSIILNVGIFPAILKYLWYINIFNSVKCIYIFNNKVKI